MQPLAEAHADRRMADLGRRPRRDNVGAAPEAGLPDWHYDLPDGGVAARILGCVEDLAVIAEIPTGYGSG
jgi:hypothetical protein